MRLPYFAQPLEANNNYPATSFSQVQINLYESPNHSQRIPSQYETAQNLLRSARGSFAANFTMKFHVKNETK